MESISLIANGATALGFLVLAWQSWFCRKAVKAQTRAIEVQAYTTLNNEFLSIISEFKETINDPNTREVDLTPDERRALDRYFYLANTEFILIKEGVVDARMGEYWKRSIESAAKKAAFRDRWRSHASKYSLDQRFKVFFESALLKA